MTGPSVLIAALSGRAIAAAARRAGFAPLVVDAFGDLDMRESARAYHHLPAAAHQGFRARTLLPALDALAAEATRPPVGLVLGSGFEDTPGLVATLARHFTLLGNSAETIRRAKDPGTLFPLLDRLAIPHPETLQAPPSCQCGWLTKRIGASGGGHVLPYNGAHVLRGRYFQRRLEGTPVSLLCLCRDGAAHIGETSRQWTVGSGRRPYRYGGATGPEPLDDRVAVRMRSAAEALVPALDLRGLVSFDFHLSQGTPYLLEVNPRPGATIDIFDNEAGRLFAAHVAACAGSAPPDLPAAGTGARAAAILYAEEGPLTVPAIDWPSWTADRPAPGTRVSRGRPLATVFASAESATAAEFNCRQRLDELARMLYGRAADTEHNNAKIHRSRRERIGASSQAR